LYCLLLDPWIQWSSFLLHANLPDAEDMVAIIRGVAHARGRPITVKQGDMIQVIGYGAAIPPVLELDDLLFAGEHWEPEPPLAFSSSFSHFWVLHEGGSRGIDADYHKITSAYGFQEFAADTLQFAQYRTTLKTASPRIQDAVFKGVLCKAVVLVTECLPTLPVPPARVTTPLTVVFLDMRPVLRGLDWRIIVQGEVDIEVFKQGLKLDIPPGFVLKVAGGNRVSLMWMVAMTVQILTLIPAVTAVAPTRLLAGKVQLQEAVRHATIRASILEFVKLPRAAQYSIFAGPYGDLLQEVCSLGGAQYKRLVANFPAGLQSLTHSMLPPLLDILRHQGAIIAVDSRAINDRLFAAEVIGQTAIKSGVDALPTASKRSLRALVSEMETLAFRLPLEAYPPWVRLASMLLSWSNCQWGLLLQATGPPDEPSGPPGWGGEDEEPWRSNGVQAVPLPLLVMGTALLLMAAHVSDSAQPAAEQVVSGNAFFLASTLIETLVEHFVPDAAAGPDYTCTRTPPMLLPLKAALVLKMLSVLKSTLMDPFMVASVPGRLQSLTWALHPEHCVVGVAAQLHSKVNRLSLVRSTTPRSRLRDRLGPLHMPMVAPGSGQTRLLSLGRLAGTGEDPLPLYSQNHAEPWPMRLRLPAMFAFQHSDMSAPIGGTYLTSSLMFLAKGTPVIGQLYKEDVAKGLVGRATETVVSETHFRFTSAANHKGFQGLELVAQTSVCQVYAWRDSWWRKFVDDLRGYAGDLPVVVLGDLNLRLSEPWADRIGDLCWEEGASPPAPFFKMLLNHGLWAPSTFTACHRGLSHTWVSPGQGTLSRIDFILVPTTWNVDHGSSRVLYEVDFGQAGLDHFAVYLEVSAILDASCHKGRRPPRIDVSRLQAPENANVVQAICKTVPAVPWDVDAHTHYELFSRHLVEHLALAFPANQASRRKSFFSDGTWSFRQQRVSLRKLAHRASAWIANYEVRVAWVAWSCAGPMSWAGLLSFADLLRSDPSKEINAASHRRLREQLPLAPLRMVILRLTLRQQKPGGFEWDLADYDIGAEEILTRAQIEDGWRPTCGVEEKRTQCGRHFENAAMPLGYGRNDAEQKRPDETSIQNVIATLGLDAAVGPRLQAYVREQSLIRAAGGPTVLSSMVEESNCDTWFSHGALEGTAIVKAGTRPGDNLADLIFSFLFAELLAVLRKRFSEAGLSSALPWNDAWLRAGPEAPAASGPADVARPIDVTWMDDLALLVEDPHPDKLLDKVVAVATATLDECMKATLVPNLTEGKTECVLALCGPGSKKIAAQVFRGSSPDLSLHSDIWPDARLRLVSTYKHVGGLVQAGGGTAKEVRSRIGAAWAAFRQHRRQVFSSPLVQARDKAVLFSSVVESTLFYGVGAWPAHDEAATGKFRGALIGMARLMLRPRFSYTQARHLSGLYALACARIMPAEITIALERLRHLRLVVSKGCAEFWALLHAEQSWLHQAQQALTWAGELRTRASLKGPDLSDWDTAAAIARHDAGRWKSLVKQTKIAAGL
ncbi:unnamed protein product, partial [Symbiodinium necroappetens]